MPDIEVNNPTKNVISIWWGHTPYILNPGETIAMPSIVAKECLNHNDYKKLVIVGGEVPGPTPVKEVYPWDDENWDPLVAPEEELKAYADEKNMVWNKEDTQIMRDSIYESLME
jgi:hypothetical protein